jgi:hypothetical protein
MTIGFRPTVTFSTLPPLERHVIAAWSSEDEVKSEGLPILEQNFSHQVVESAPLPVVSTVGVVQDSSKLFGAGFQPFKPEAYR